MAIGRSINLFLLDGHPDGVIVGELYNWTGITYPKSFKQKREGLIKDNIIKDWVFTKDYLFSSPSTAAGVIMGRSANGLIEWKKKDGTTIKDNE